MEAGDVNRRKKKRREKRKSYRDSRKPMSANVARLSLQNKLIGKALERSKKQDKTAISFV